MHGRKKSPKKMLNFPAKIYDFVWFLQQVAGSGWSSFRARIALKVSEIESTENFWSIWYVKKNSTPKNKYIFFVGKKSYFFPKKITNFSLKKSFKIWNFRFWRNIFMIFKKIPKIVGFFFRDRKKIGVELFFYLPNRSGISRTFDFWHFQSDLSTLDASNAVSKISCPEKIH